jgi:putative ABC transport system permease protein
MQLRLALRNVFRNRRRTLFSLAVLVVSMSILFVVLAFQGEFLRATRLSLACETGAVQVADERLFESTATGYEYLIPPEQLDAVFALIAAEEGVLGVAQQLNFAGLVGDETGSTLIIGRGVVPCNCVQDYECIVTTGDPLAEDASRQVILGASLARKLNVRPGDRINIATGTVSGNFNAATVDVVGELTYSIEEVEKQLGLFPIAFVQRLLKTDGVERVLIGLEDLDDADAFSARLQAALDEAGIPLATRTWEELNPSFESIRSFYAAFTGLAAVGIFVFVFFSVLEVLTISFLERTREIGTLRAFGTTRWHVFRGFLIEGAALGLIGGLLGVVFGTGLTLLFNALRVTWTPPGAAIPQAIRLLIGVEVVLVPFVVAVAATLVSAVYPSWKNARLRIVDALRTS